MFVKTKFALGDVVWKAWNGNESYWQPCGFCGATGQISSADGTTVRPCPECYGRLGSTEWRPKKWLIHGRLTVGQVRISVSANEFEERYMCFETGVGSGTLHDADHLFGSEEEAQSYCDARNASEVAKAE